MTLQVKQIAALKKMAGDYSIKENELLANYTFTKTGGRAEIFIQPKRQSKIQQIVHFAHQQAIPLTILGNGSNLLISDKGIKGIVMSLHHLNEVQINDFSITVGSGALLTNVSKAAMRASLTGLEFACGIPGTIGGAVIMNAGAYGGEIADVLTSAMVLSPTGEFLTLTTEDFEFGYRKSRFNKEKLIVLEATFQLREGKQSNILKKMNKLTELRALKQPLDFPSCGSVFKRPLNKFAGKLIQEAGLQGYRIGGAEVSTKHAGFIINIDHATTTDYLQLIHYIKETVKRKTNIELETEVEIVGE